MKKLLLVIPLFICLALGAQPRGLSSRDIDVSGAVSVIQPLAEPILPALPGNESQTDAAKNWIPLQSLPLEVMLPAGEQIGACFKNLGLNAESYSSLGTLLPQSEAAVARVPQWIRVRLRNTLNHLQPDRQLLFAELLNDAPDPYVDEIAFCVATASPEYLNSSFALPELFLENAQKLYEIDGELDYVEIVDVGSAASGGDYYSTTRYWKKDAAGQLVQVTVPRDIYYWYLVNPKITDEIAAYIDPNIIESNSSHSNNIVPPPAGKFWRSYIYDHEDGDYPVLRDTLTLCQSVYNRDGSPGDVIRAITWWINQNMSFTSNNERPHQPVRIYQKRFGRCGEYADFSSAIARIALIPCTNVSSISTDHTWNEFWEEGWVSWEPVNNYLNNPLVYENGWGRVFGSVFEERSDGLFTPVTERYSEGVATINIQVVDADLQPVDGARVLLAIFENSPRFDCEAYSDNNGMVSFAVGEGRDYRARTEAAFGIYPPIAGTYAQLVSSSVAGETYSYQFQIAAPLPQASIETLPLPEDPVQDYMFTANMVSTGYFITGKSLWDDIDVLGTKPRHYKYSSEPATARLLVTDADNALFLALDNFCSACVNEGPHTMANAEFNIPVGQDWYIFADNSHQHGNTVLLSGMIEFRGWDTAVDDPQAPAAAFKLSSPAPNPTRGETKLWIDLATPQKLQVSIHDIRGRRIRELDSLKLPAGQNPLVWDGLDSQGRPASSGIYILRVKGEERQAARKIVLLK